MPAKKWSDDVRARALAIYAVDGLAAATRETGVPKGTLSKWAHRQGVTTSAPAKMVEAVEAGRQTVAARRVALSDRLLEVAEKAIDRQLVMIDGSDDLRAVVGAGTRAIHDLQLLNDLPTERHELPASPLEQVLARLASLRERMDAAADVLDAPAAGLLPGPLPDGQHAPDG